MASSCCVCGICYSFQSKIPAVVWCFDCDDGLCDECRKRHGVSRASRDHQTIPAEKYQKLSAPLFRFRQICTVHNDTYKIYCKIHDCFCCNRCVIEKHNTCKDLESIQDIIKNVKTSNTFLKMYESLKEMEKIVSNVFETITSNKSFILRDKRVIEKIILDTRERINIQLDEIQLTLTKELEDLVEKEFQKMDEFISKLKATDKAVKDYHETLSNVKEYATEFQAFLASKELEKDIEKENICLNLLCNNDSTQELHLVFNLNKTIKMFENNAKSFGHISAEYLQKFSKDDENQGQYVQIQQHNSIDDISLSLVGSFTIPCKMITSCVLLPNGTSVFSCDCEGLFISKPNGTNNFVISVKPYYGWDVTFIPSTNSLAIPCNKIGKHSIRTFDLEKQQLTQSIAMDANYYGICHKVSVHTKPERVATDVKSPTSYSHHKEDVISLVVIGSEGIQMITFQDKSVRTVLDQKIPGTPFISTFGDALYYTINSNSKSVLKEWVSEGICCCDFQGNLKWMFADDKILKCPKGITVDNEGCVYVAGYHSNNVIVLSPNGSQHTVLLSSQDGLEAPTGIDYDRSTNQLLVTNKSDKAFLYSIKKT